MASVAQNRSMGVWVIAILAVVQGVFGVLRAFHWFDIGSDLMGQGLLIIPLVGMVAFLRGIFVAVFALLYIVFACGMFLRWTWASWAVLIPVAVNFLLVFGLIAQGEPLARTIPWLIVPVVILFYLFSPAGRKALKGEG